MAGGTHRIVLTSSLTAASPAPDYHGSPTDETLWTDLSAPGVTDYARSKTLAERDAWAFMEGQSGSTLSTVLPGMIVGPVLGPDFSGSIELISRMMSGKLPLLPRLGFTMGDVRDLADLHVRAMESPETAGERIIGTGDFLSLREAARILRERFGTRAAKVPTRGLPDFGFRLMALFSADARFMVPRLGQRYEFNIGKAARLLDWHPRPAAQAVVDTAESLLAQGLV